jgi:hypothetical protein
MDSSNRDNKFAAASASESQDSKSSVVEREARLNFDIAGGDKLFGESAGVSAIAKVADDFKNLPSKTPEGQLIIYDVNVNLPSKAPQIAAAQKALMPLIEHKDAKAPNIVVLTIEASDEVVNRPAFIDSFFKALWSALKTGSVVTLDIKGNFTNPKVGAYLLQLRDMLNKDQLKFMCEFTIRLSDAVLYAYGPGRDVPMNKDVLAEIQELLGKNSNKLNAAIKDDTNAVLTGTFGLQPSLANIVSAFLLFKEQQIEDAKYLAAKAQTSRNG